MCVIKTVMAQYFSLVAPLWELHFKFAILVHAE